MITALNELPRYTRCKVFGSETYSISLKDEVRMMRLYKCIICCMSKESWNEWLLGNLKRINDANESFKIMIPLVKTQKISVFHFSMVRLGFTCTVSRSIMSKWAFFWMAFRMYCTATLTWMRTSCSHKISSPRVLPNQKSISMFLSTSKKTGE